MLNSLKYEVIEDNAGGLSLFVFEDVNGDGNEKIIYEHSGYEHIKGQLQKDLEALHAGAHPDSWDGAEDSPQDDYDTMTNSEYEYEIVASRDYYGSPEIHVAEMGLSALREFDREEG